MMEKQTSKSWQNGGRTTLKTALKYMGVEGGGRPGDGDGMNRGAEEEKSGRGQWLNLVPSESSQVSIGQKRDRRLGPYVGCCLFIMS